MVAQRKWSRYPISALALCAAVFAPARAQEVQVDRRIPYQGVLEGATGPVAIELKLFHAGDDIWGPEVHEIVPDENGRFAIVIGDKSLDIREPINIPDLDHIPYPIEDLQLEISIRQEDGTLVALTPRQNLFPAWHADTAEFALSVADDAVTSQKIRDGSVESRDIRDGSIANNDLADDSVTSSKIAEGQITTDGIADRTITREDIALSAIGDREIGSNAIKLRHLDTSEGEINLATIPGQVNGGQVQDGSITQNDLASGYITLSQKYDAEARNSGTTTVRMVRADGSSICFLSRAMVRDTDGGDEYAGCDIIQSQVGSSQYWHLRARLQSSDDADAFCSAYCIDWK